MTVLLSELISEKAAQKGLYLVRPGGWHAGKVAQPWGSPCTVKNPKYNYQTVGRNNNKLRWLWIRNVFFLPDYQFVSVSLVSLHDDILVRLVIIFRAMIKS